MIPFVLNVVFFGWACLVAVYLYACGDLKKGDDGSVTISWDETLQYMSLYHLFGIFWTTQFIVGLGVMFTAGAIAAYYWQRESMPKSPIRRSIHRAVRYHVGSIALGAFIVAVVQFIRAVLSTSTARRRRCRRVTGYQVRMCCVKYCGASRRFSSTSTATPTSSSPSGLSYCYPVTPSSSSS